MKKLLLFAMVFTSIAFSIGYQASFTVKGVLKDKQGNPIAFATVQEKGTKNGSTTNENGNFSLTVSNPNAVLVFRAVGYSDKEIKIKKQSFLNVVMEQNSMALQEVVVTGLSIKRDQAVSYVAPSLGTMSTGSYQLSNSNGYSPDGANTEDYSNIAENEFHRVTDEPLSTFSIDVDAASYSNVRRFLNASQMPPEGAVRVEEMINYFTYNYPEPAGDQPFSINTELRNCPWSSNKLLLVGLQGKHIPVTDLPASNLVFLIDVSGSMEDENKLPLVKSSLKLLTDQLREQDKISIVVYAGNAGLVLPATSGACKQKIKTAINNLEAGGSTAGGEGIKLAYTIAMKNFIKDGNNRVILCTDGDFNVGESSDDAMVRLIEKKRESRIFLTVLGYGMGNYKDNKMQQLADKGNGNHAYIDGINEARKVLVNEFGGTLFTIAKDVKLQVEFNPALVAGYRLIGYENRLLNKEDFKDDTKDAGEMGSGHTVTALYEIIPAGVPSPYLKTVDTLKYQHSYEANSSTHGNEWVNIRLRYKAPQGDVSKLLEQPVMFQAGNKESMSENFRFASAVAGFGMLLRNSKFKGDNSYEKIRKLAATATGSDKEGYRQEFITLVKTAERLNSGEKEEEE